MSDDKLEVNGDTLLCLVDDEKRNKIIVDNLISIKKELGCLRLHMEKLTTCMEDTAQKSLKIGARYGLIGGAGAAAGAYALDILYRILSNMR